MGNYEADAPRPKGSDQPNRGPDIERLLMLLENASEGSRELNAHVFCAVAHPDKKPQRNFFYRNREEWGVFVSNQTAPSLTFHDAPPYTTSLDAALTLVPESVRGWVITKRSSGRFWAEFSDETEEEGDWYSANSIISTATTPELALCIAAIRALAPPDARASGASAQDE